MASSALPSSFSRRNSFDSFLSSRWQGPAPHNYSLQMQGLVSPGEARSARFRDDAPTPGNDVSSRFGRRLRELRLTRNLTQSEMGRRFGIDRSFISDVERGRKSISLPMLEVIALGMNISLAELFIDV
jgi:DNA-binding XRE family transcriptional regulator